MIIISSPFIYCVLTCAWIFLKKAEMNLKEKMKGNKSGRFNLEEIFDTSIITQGMRYALVTGNWGKNRIGAVLKTGVAQVLQSKTAVKRH